VVFILKVYKIGLKARTKMLQLKVLKRHLKVRVKRLKRSKRVLS